VGVPAGRIKTVAEVCESEHLKARGMIVKLPHPTAEQVTVLGIPVRLHGTPGAADMAPPLLGQHTDEILKSALGMKPAAIARLRRDAVI
jgi:crotonobetainyl-CoA:carnitine CoA-transferase CaiB-like acyl-CoA transferase